jgi:hypothetical protein
MDGQAILLVPVDRKLPCFHLLGGERVFPAKGVADHRHGCRLLAYCFQSVDALYTPPRSS